MLLDQQANFPQGLKPQILCVSDGTAEAMHFQDSIDATSSSYPSRLAPYFPAAGPADPRSSFGRGVSEPSLTKY